MKLPLGIDRASFIVVAMAVAFTIYYIAIGFPDIDRSEAGGQESKLEKRKTQQAIKVAAEVCKRAPRGSVVLAPKRVSHHLLGRTDCPKPFFVDAERSNLRVSEKQKRRAMVRYVEFMGDLPFSEAHPFVEQLRRHRIRVVVMSQEGIRNPRIKQLLRQSSFEKIELIETYHIWVQRDSWQVVEQRHRREAEQLCRHVPEGSYVLAPYGVSEQLDRLGRCRSFLYHPSEAFANTHFKERRDLLEGVLSADNDPTPAELSVLNQVLQSQLIRGIVLIQDGNGSKKLKNELKRNNFKLATKRDYYRLWIPKDGIAK